jgi:class 3 adenylate cyclase
MRLGASPQAAEIIVNTLRDIDVRHVLATIRVPTLILDAVGDRTVDVRHARHMAKRIASAKLVELPGADHVPWLADGDVVLAEIGEFLTGARPLTEPDRVLATVLFTDIVKSTEKAASLGDRRWHELLDRHNMLVRQEITHWRGREVATQGDGFLALFDGPARAVRCAQSVVNSMQSLGLEVRCGLHCGECETIGDNVGGIAVRIGARVAALCRSQRSPGLQHGKGPGGGPRAALHPIWRAQAARRAWGVAHLPRRSVVRQPGDPARCSPAR